MIHKRRKTARQEPDFRQYRFDWLWKQLTQADSYQPKFPWERRRAF